MRQNTKVLIGFLLIIVLIIIQGIISYKLQTDIPDATRQIKNIEVPLKATSQQMLCYESMLTEPLHVALLRALKENNTEIQNHRERYDEIAAKLNDLIKKEAKMLLWQSKRPQEIKEKIDGYIETIDRANTKILELETKAFEAIGKNDVETAYSLIFGEEYDRYERELNQAYNDWIETEQTAYLSVQDDLLKGSRQIIYLNLGISIVIMVIVIITMFIIRSFITEQHSLKRKK